MYEPGTPVKVTIRDQEVLAYAFYGNAEPRLRWYVPNPPWPIKTHDPLEDFDTWFLGIQGTNPRPLLVVDPEDADGMRELYYAIRERQDLMPLDVAQVTAAVRDMLAPPLEEPTGWLAAVADRDGNRWFRDGEADTDCPWRQVREDGIHGRDRWDSMPTAALTVLTQGYIPEAGR